MYRPKTDNLHIMTVGVFLFMIYSLPETNSSSMNMNGWKMKFLLRNPRGELLVSGRVPPKAKKQDPQVYCKINFQLSRMEFGNEELKIKNRDTCCSHWFDCLISQFVAMCSHFKLMIWVAVWLLLIFSSAKSVSTKVVNAAFPSEVVNVPWQKKLPGKTATCTTWDVKKTLQINYGWWQLKHFFVFTPILGEWSNLTIIFVQLGWFNHQLDLCGQKGI